MSLPPGATSGALPGGGFGVLAEEVPVALVFDGTTQAVMMASPTDLDDFLLGFALAEGLIAHPAELARQEVVAQSRGIEARGWLAGAASARFAQRRRGMAGPVGCGLCGLESLQEALRVLPRAGKALPGFGVDVAQQALDALRAAQPLHDAVRASHAAGFFVPGRGPGSGPGRGMVALREDIGRHNALDKLAGALARQGIDPAGGAVVLTSRISVDLVQKAVTIGAGALVGASAPTALAVEEAQRAGLGLIARGQAGYRVFSAAREGA